MTLRPAHRVVLSNAYSRQLQDPQDRRNRVVSLHLMLGLRVDELRRAIEQVTARHPLFRSVLELVEDDSLRLRVGSEPDVALTVADLRHLASDAQQVYLADVCRRETTTPLDPKTESPLRWHVAQLGDEELRLTIAADPVLVDGRAQWVLIRDVLAQYTETPTNSDLPTPTAGSSAVSVAEADQRAHWSRSLAGCRPPGPDAWPMPLESAATAHLSREQDLCSSEANDGDAGPIERIVVPTETARRLAGAARKLSVPLELLLLAVHVKAVGVATGQSDVVTGVGLDLQAPDTTGELAMPTTNVLPMRVQLGHGTWSDLVGQVAAAHHELQTFRQSALADVQAWSGIDRLVATSFAYNHSFLEVQAYADELSDLGLHEIAFGAAPHPGILSADVLHEVDSNRLEIRLRATPELSDRQLRTVARYYRDLLGAATSVDAVHGSYSPLTADEREQILVQWNEDIRAYPVHRCVHELFEEQVVRTPDVPAVEDGTVSLTYRQLNETANQVARHLQAQGIGRGDVVALAVPRDANLVVLLLAVLKSGAAYLPLDRRHPTEALRYMLADAGVVLAVTDEDSAGSFPAGSWTTVGTTTLLDHAARSAPGDLAVPSSPADLVYIIYTSGSTGRPKGVAVPHSGVVNYLAWCIDAYTTRGSGGAPVFSSIAFDMIVPNLFTPLLTGQRVCVIDDLPDAVALADRLIAASPFSFIKLTPGQLSVLTSMLEPGEAAALAGTLAVGADSFPRRTLDAWLRLSDAALMLNEYGPTEASVGNTVHFLTNEPEGTELPIGRPIPNTAMYVLDDALQPVPPGVLGELYIGGACVVRGYVGKAVLTAARFVADPFSPDPGARMYRTGDLGRWRPDGSLEFAGRTDDQVKIRGFRVEPGEIEAVLGEHPRVATALVAVLGDLAESRMLVGYYVPATGEPLNDLREYMSARLPDHLVPSVYVAIDSVPLTTNGKVDRKALPKPTTGAGARTAVGDTSQSPLQQVVERMSAASAGTGRRDGAPEGPAWHEDFAARLQLALLLQRELGIEDVLEVVNRSKGIAELSTALEKRIAEDRPVDDRTGAQR
jgi:amino acid adenylation domain-containing protein